MRPILRQKSSRLENSECFCSDPTDCESTIRLSCRCLVHRRCLVSYIRNQMEDRLSLMFTMRRLKQIGFLCPYAGANFCAGNDSSSGFINTADLEVLFRTAEPNNQGMVAREDALLPSEIEKLKTWISEDNPTSLLTESGPPSISISSKGIAGDDTQPAETVDFNNDFIEATSKPCPECRFRVTHWHGHACHHIAPSGGCPRCKIGFCE